jgi:hypothetical protein
VANRAAARWWKDRRSETNRVTAVDAWRHGSVIAIRLTDARIEADERSTILWDGAMSQIDFSNHSDSGPDSDTLVLFHCMCDGSVSRGKRKRLSFGYFSLEDKEK